MLGGVFHNKSETPCVVATGNIGRRFIVGTAVVVVKRFAYRGIVNAENRIGIVFVFHKRGED